jgi:hypothetical protein
MSDLPTPVRDETGRFVKSETSHPALSQDDMHPVSRILFGWLSTPRAPLIAFWAAVVLAVVLVLLDSVLPGEAAFPFARFNGFFAVFGFLALVVAVVICWPLSGLVRRQVDYYGEGDDTPLQLDREREE